MFRHRFFGRRVAGFGAAVALALATSGAFAQPGPGGPGPGGFGPHGGDPLTGVIAQLKTQLSLDTSQQLLWDSAVAASKQARQDGRALMQQVHDAMAAELAKAEPNLAAVAAVADDAQAQGQVLRKKVRDAWLQLYATFTPSQKALVRDALAARAQRFEQMRQRWSKSG